MSYGEILSSFLIDLQRIFRKKIKIQTPKVISMKISVKQIDKLITEWSKPVPFDKILSEIREREEREKQIEQIKRGD